MPLYVGIDQSLTETGLCFNTVVGYTLQSIKPGKMRGLERLDFIRNELMMRINPKTKYDLIAIEGYAMGIKLGGRTFDLGELGGILKLAIYDRNIPLIVVPPTLVKKFVTGIGNCQKDVILKEVYRKWGLDTNNNNYADAFALAKIAEAFHMWKTKEIMWPSLKYEQDVLKKIELET